MPGIFGPSIVFGSDQGPIYPNNMYVWNESGEQSQNIGQLGTNILEPIMSATTDTSITYTLDNGNTVEVQKIFSDPSDPTSDFNYKINTSPGISGHVIVGKQAGVLLCDGAYFCLNPYDPNISDVNQWNILKHVPPPGYGYQPPGYFYTLSSGLVNFKYLFSGSEYTDDADYIKPDGGMGLLDTDSDPIPFPALPNAKRFIDTGMIGAYRLELSQVQAFASYLWSPDFINDMKKIYNDPMEAVISFHLVPVTPTYTPSNIFIGTNDTNILANKVSDQYYYINFGKIEVDEYIGTFYDWSPYTKAEIYLPFIGVKQIDIDEIMGSQLWLQYMVDVLTGDFVAMLHIKRIRGKNNREKLNGILYHWNGNCAVSCPISAKDYKSFYATAINSVFNIGQAAASGAQAGGAAGAGLAAAGALISSIPTTLTTPIPIQHSGNIAGTHGIMGIQTPYVILSRPTVRAPQTIKHDAGFKSQISMKIGDLSGFVKMAEVHVDGILRATQAEKDEIERLLKEGITI